MTVLLAADAEAGASMLRVAYSADEMAALEAAVDAAQRSVDAALGIRHGAEMNRLLDELAGAEAERDAALPYVDQAVDFRVGQIIRLGDSLLRVLRVAPTKLVVERGIDGTVPTDHTAGTELTPIPAIGAATIEVLVDGSGSPIEAGAKGQVLLPFPGRIERVRLIADQAGSAVVDIVRSTFVDPPGSGVSITAAAKPALDDAASYDDEVLEDWTRELAVDEVLGAVIEEATTIERLTLVLTVAL